MFLKIMRGVWFISILGALASLLLVYAGLPEEMVILQEGTDFLTISKEVFFYVSLLVIAIVNSFVFMVGALYQKDEALRTWFNGLIAVLNLFFVVSFFLVSAMNSNEKFAYERIGFMVYGSVALIALWAIAWPIYFMIRKFSGKHVV